MKLGYLFRILPLFACALVSAQSPETSATGPKSPLVYVIPIRENIMPPLLYVVRRGVKEAMEHKADLIVLDMETNGGRVDVTEDLIDSLGKFKGQTATYINDKAISAGAFISVATQSIYMAPGAVIGAAAPVMSGIGGGVPEMSNTMEEKINAVIREQFQAVAEKNGYNTEVVEAMINMKKELVIDGEVISKEGELLVLRATRAAKKYGDPPTALLSSGTVDTIMEVIALLGFENAEVVRVQPTGAEKLASMINVISPLLLMIGLLGLYIEFKTPGFGFPGILGIVSFLIYFMGGYIAGLSGMEWLALFLIGILLIVIELFVTPGAVVFGLAGAACMLVGLVMKGVDIYPGMPPIPTVPQLEPPLMELAIGFGGALIIALFLAKLLPRSPLYKILVSERVSGGQTVQRFDEEHASWIGMVGKSVSPLCPGGKAQFGDQVLDVITQGEMIEYGRQVRVVKHSANQAVVESTD